MPDRISITAVAIANSPSDATVWTGRWTAPSWSGTYSSKMLVPSSKSSDAQTNESISRAGLDAGVRVRDPRGLEHQLLVRDPRTWWGRSRTSRSRPPRLAAPSTRLYRVGVQDVVWSPSPEYIERANVTRFMRAHGIATYEELVARSVGDIAWFWDAVVRDLGISFLTPYEQVLDTSRGVEWATWFTGGKTNLAHQCLDVWAHRTPEAVAVVWEAEDGDVRRVTYRGAPGADRPAGARAALAGRAATRHRRHLHADGRRDRRGPPRMLQDRGDLGTDLQRLRPGSRRRAPGRCERVDVDHRGRFAPAGPTGADEGDRRSRRGRGRRRSAIPSSGTDSTMPTRPGTTSATFGGRTWSPRNRPDSTPSRSTVSIRCSSATRAGRPAGRKACCTSTPASW